MVLHVETWRAASLQTQPKNRPMSDDLFQNKYKIESARAEWHDYNGGSYFITICTKHREHFFGEIVDGEMVLSDIGKYADEQFNNVSSHYPYAEIPLLTIMPNHLHAIVVIDGNKTKYDRRVVETWRAASLQEIANLQGWLSVVIGGLKSSITRFANEKTNRFRLATPFSRPHHPRHPGIKPRGDLYRKQRGELEG